MSRCIFITSIYNCVAIWVAQFVEHQSTLPALQCSIPGLSLRFSLESDRLAFAVHIKSIRGNLDMVFLSCGNLKNNGRGIAV